MCPLAFLIYCCCGSGYSLDCEYEEHDKEESHNNDNSDNDVPDHCEPWQLNVWQGDA